MPHVGVRPFAYAIPAVGCGLRFFARRRVFGREQGVVQRIYAHTQTVIVLVLP